MGELINTIKIIKNLCSLIMLILVEVSYKKENRPILLERVWDLVIRL